MLKEFDLSNSKSLKEFSDALHNSLENSKNTAVLVRLSKDDQSLNSKVKNFAVDHQKKGIIKTVVSGNEFVATNKTARVLVDKYADLKAYLDAIDESIMIIEI